MKVLLFIQLILFSTFCCAQKDDLYYEHSAFGGVSYSNTNNQKTALSQILIEFKQEQIFIQVISGILFYKNFGISYNLEMSDIDGTRRFYPLIESHIRDKYLERYTTKRIVKSGLTSHDLIRRTFKENKILLGINYKIPVGKFEIYTNISVGKFTQFYKNNYEVWMTDLSGSDYYYSIKSNTVKPKLDDRVKSTIYSSAVKFVYPLFDPIKISVGVQYQTYNLNTVYEEEFVNLRSGERIEGKYYFTKAIHTFGFGAGMQILF